MQTTNDNDESAIIPCYAMLCRFSKKNIQISTVSRKKDSHYSRPPFSLNLSPVVGTGLSALMIHNSQSSSGIKT